MARKAQLRGGRKVKNPKQAIAIALSEAGASNRESPEANRRNRRRTEERERADRTASPRERLGSQASKTGRARTRAELYAEAKRRDIPGRSKMSRAELETALRCGRRDPTFKGSCLAIAATVS